MNLGDWRNYLDIAFDDMFPGDSQWSLVGHCTPGVTTCPKGTPMTGTIRMTPADVSYAVQWEQQHHFTIEFLYNGGASARFAVNGVDALLVATRPVAKDFYWVNHTYRHAYMGCKLRLGQGRRRQRGLPGQHGYAMPQAAEPEDRLDLLYRARASPDRL